MKWECNYQRDYIWLFQSFIGTFQKWASFFFFFRSQVMMSWVQSRTNSLQGLVYKLQGLLVQSSKWFGISLVQFSSLLTSLTGKCIHFSSGRGGQVPPFSSVHSVYFTWLESAFISFQGSVAKCLRSVQFIQFISRAFPQGCGAGAGTFRPEPEPSEHFSSQPELSKNRLRLQKRGKNHNK